MGRAGLLTPAVLLLVPGAHLFALDLSWIEPVVRFLSSPILAPILLAIGVLGLLFEMKAGAFGLGGLVSLAALAIFFGAHVLVGLAGWGDVLLLLGGLIFLAVEMFVLPGFGVAGILGALMVGASVVLAMVGSAPTTGDIFQALAVLGVALVLTGTVVYTWLRHLPNSSRFRGLLLDTSLHSDEGYVSALPRPELVGKDGVAATDLRPAGTVLLGEERIDAVSEEGYIRAGTPVRVTRAEGYRHVVRAVPKAGSPA